MVGKKKACYSYPSSRRTITVTTAISPPKDLTNEKRNTTTIEAAKEVEEASSIHPAPLPVYIPRPRMDQAGPIDINMGPPMPIPVLPKGNKNDDFYKYWDRFTRVKEKKDALKVKAEKKVVTKKDKDGANKAETEVEVKGEEKPSKGREGPSLDKDVEGRPGHPMVRSNTEGVISRYVRFILGAIYLY
jgi:hypothetical protein